MFRKSLFYSVGLFTQTALCLAIVSRANLAEASLALNLDASAAATLNGGAISDGQSVSSWGQQFGKTGSLALTEAGPLFQPTYDADGLDGLPAVRFDGINDRLSGAFGNLVGSDDWTVFFVGQTLDPAQDLQNIFAQPNGFTSAGGGLSIRYSGDAAGWNFRHRDGIGGESQDNIEFPPVDDDNNPGTQDRSGGRGEVALRGISADGTTFYSYYNDVSPLATAADSGSTLWSSTGDTYVGTRSNFTRFFNGNVSQIAVFDSQLVGADLTDVQQALSEKWSLGVDFGGNAAAGNLLLQEPASTPVEAVAASNYFVTDLGNEGIDDNGTPDNPDDDVEFDNQLDNIGDAILVGNFAPPAGRFFGDDADSNRLGFYVFQLPEVPAGQTLGGVELNAFLARNSATAADGTLNFVGLRASSSSEALTTDYEDALNAGGALDADFDSSGTAAGGDFLVWQKGFGTDAGSGNTAEQSEGNANEDQFIDGADLAVWEDEFGQAGGSGAVVIESDWADPSTPADNAPLPALNETSHPELLTFLEDAYADVGAGGYVFFATTIDQVDLDQGTTAEHGYRVRAGKDQTSFNPMLLQLVFSEAAAGAPAVAAPEPAGSLLALLALAGVTIRIRAPRSHTSA